MNILQLFQNAIAQKLHRAKPKKRKPQGVAQMVHQANVKPKPISKSAGGSGPFGF
jgi:hypothetical protein